MLAIQHRRGELEGQQTRVRRQKKTQQPRMRLIRNLEPEEEEGGKSKEENEVPKCTVREKAKAEPKRRGKVIDQVSSEESGSSSLSLPYERGSRNQSGIELPEAVPVTSYEWLGIRTSEPSSRPPILPLTRENEQRVAWAGKDCSPSGAFIRRARPLRSLEGMFFDRLESLRRVVLNEAAKARDSMEAVAVLGAEEAYGTMKARSVVLETAPGNLDELAARIASDKRPGRFTRKREAYAKTDSTKQGKGQSKVTLPYSCKPFLQRGARVLHIPWRPREAVTPSTSRCTWRRGGGPSEPSLEGLEEVWGTKDALPMATKWRSPRVARETTRHVRGIQSDEKELTPGPSDKRRDGTAHQRWGIYPRERPDVFYIPSVSRPKELGRHETHSRSTGSQCSPKGPTFLPAWHQRGCRSHEEQFMALRPRFAKGLSTSLYGLGGKTQSRSSGWRENNRFVGTPIRAVSQPIHLYKVDKLVGETDPQEDRLKCSRLYRRLPNRGSK